jgi:hypothetical protein
MKRTQLYIDEVMYIEIEKEAKLLKRTVSDLVREMLERELKLKNKVKADNTSKLLTGLIGIAGQGPSDLSVKGEDYLLGEILK